MSIKKNRYEKLLADYDKHSQRIWKATTIDILESPEAKTKRIKWLEEDYIRWFEYYFPNYAKKKSAWFHRKAGKLLTEHNQIYLLFEVYRSGGKTVHITMGIPLFRYFKKILSYFIVMGQTERKAQRLLSGIQIQLRYNQRLINDYGERFKIGDWANGDLSTTDGARFRSFGFGQSPRGEQEEGQRPEMIVVDDSDTKKHLNNEDWMKEAEDFIVEDLIGCFDTDPDATRIFAFANNNFHKKSLTNRIKIRFEKSIAKAKQLGTRRIHHILSVPAVKDLKTFEPNWPEKTTAQFWKELYVELMHKSFCREYQHIHVDDGKKFKAKFMQWKRMLPLRHYDALVFYGDLSYKDAADFKGMFLVGKIGRELHIIYSFLRQCSRTAVARWLYDLYEDKRLNRFNIKYKIDGLFAQDEFVSDFDNEGDERGYHIPILPDRRPKAAKYDRIETLEAFFERLWIFFNEAEKNNADQIELLDQFYAFEKGSKAHDDGPDAVHGAIDEVNKTAHAEKFPPRLGGLEHDTEHDY